MSGTRDKSRLERCFVACYSTQEQRTLLGLLPKIRNLLGIYLEHISKHIKLGWGLTMGFLCLQLRALELNKLYEDVAATKVKN